jgi:hypothetical protein
MPWNEVQFSAEQVQLGVNLTLTNAYSLIRTKAGGPRNTAIYSRQAADGSLTVYFSGKASELAPELLLEYNAQPCEQPTGVSMVAGDQSDNLAL